MPVRSAAPGAGSPDRGAAGPAGRAERPALTGDPASPAITGGPAAGHPRLLTRRTTFNAAPRGSGTPPPGRSATAAGVRLAGPGSLPPASPEGPPLSAPRHAPPAPAAAARWPVAPEAAPRSARPEAQASAGA